MAFWNRRRPRRVDRLRPEGVVAWHEHLRSRRVLAQVGLVAAFIVGSLLIVQGPRPPLPVRKGDRTTHPILSRVDFQYVDHDVTADVRELAALARAPGLYAPDPRQAIAARESLLRLVDAVSKADAPQTVPEALRAAWRLAPETLAALRKAAGPEPERLQAVHEAVTAALAAAADPASLPVVRDEDYQRAAARLQRIKDLLGKLPAGLSTDLLPDPQEPLAQILLVLPDGERPLPLHAVMTATQADRIQPRIARALDAPLRPIFGAAGLAAVAEVLAPQIGPTLAYNQALTENRRADVRASVPPVPVLRKADTTLVEAGAEITDAELRLLEQEQAAHLARMDLGHRVLVWAGAGAILALLTALHAAFAALALPQVARSTGRILGLLLLGLAVLGLAKIVAQVKGPVESYALLLATAGMIVAITYTPTCALSVSGLLVLLVAIATRADLDWAMTALAGTGAAILGLGEIKNRSRLIKVGALAGLVLFATHSALAFWRLEYGRESFWDVLRLILWPSSLYFCVGVASGIIMLALLPFIERLFGVVTAISLLELCDVNQPALRRLALEAPGTYTHSLLIGSLAEAAAEAIGAGGLLARVGAYFHDIGKASKPRYFVENYQDGQASHNGLTPAMSRLIIQSHVKDGLEMADRLRLPPLIKRFIEEHHGTTRMEYFYHQAVEQAKACGAEPPAESDYRYPGPKPRSPETAVVMLADAVEGATRSLKERTPGRIGDVVHDLVMKRLLDGQLDASGLTLSDLRRVEETLTKALLSVYHGRVPYPSAPAAGEAEDGGERGAANRGGPDAAPDSGHRNESDTRTTEPA